MEGFKNFIDGSLRAEIYVFIGIATAISLFSIIASFLIKKADPLKKPKGLVFLIESFVAFMIKFVDDTMGKNFRPLAPYLCFLIIIIPLCFLAPLFGLAGPFNVYSVPLTFALITVFLIHIASIRFNGIWGWFKNKFLSPFFIFFPINLIAFFVPLISLSFRIFGNATAGKIVVDLVYWAGENLSNSFGIQYNIFGSLFAAPLHLIFDVMTTVVQTMVFVMLTAMFIALEKSEQS